MKVKQLFEAKKSQLEPWQVNANELTATPNWDKLGFIADKRFRPNKDGSVSIAKDSAIMYGGAQLAGEGYKYTGVVDHEGKKLLQFKIKSARQLRLQSYDALYGAPDQCVSLTVESHSNQPLDGGFTKCGELMINCPNLKSWGNCKFTASNVYNWPKIKLFRFGSVPLDKLKDHFEGFKNLVIYTDNPISVIDALKLPGLRGLFIRDFNMPGPGSENPYRELNKLIFDFMKVDSDYYTKLSEFTELLFNAGYKDWI